MVNWNDRTVHQKERNSDKVFAGKVGGQMTRARHDPKDPSGYTAAGLASMHGLGRFLKQVDEECPGLPNEERERRAIALKKIWHMRIGRLGGQSRSRK